MAVKTFSSAKKIHHVLEICLFYSSAISDTGLKKSFMWNPTNVRLILLVPISILPLFSMLSSEVTLIIIQLRRPKKRLLHNNNNNKKNILWVKYVLIHFHSLHASLCFPTIHTSFTSTSRIEPEEKSKRHECMSAEKLIVTLVYKTACFFSHVFTVCACVWLAKGHLLCVRYLLTAKYFAVHSGLMLFEQQTPDYKERLKLRSNTFQTHVKKFNRNIIRTMDASTNRVPWLTMVK